MVFPDYENSILALPNGVLARFGAPAHGPTLPALDAALRRHEKILWVILDGLGSATLRRARGHFIEEISRFSRRESRLSRFCAGNFEEIRQNPQEARRLKGGRLRQRRNRRGEGVYSSAASFAMDASRRRSASSRPSR